MDFNDLDSLDGGERKGMTAEEIRKGAHVVNSGEETFSCKACNGHGKFVSYTGRVVGDCFKCKGKGRVTARQISAQKGVETRKQNDAQWQQDHAAVISYARLAANNGFRLMGRMIAKLEENGRWNASDLEYVTKFYQQEADRQAAREAQLAEKKGAARSKRPCRRSEGYR